MFKYFTCFRLSDIREFVVAVCQSEMGNTLVARYNGTRQESQCEQVLCPMLLKSCRKSSLAI